MSFISVVPGRVSPGSRQIELGELLLPVRAGALLLLLRVSLGDAGGGASAMASATELSSSSRCLFLTFAMPSTTAW